MISVLGRRLKTDERGITAAVVAITIVALIGAAMITVDAGNIWTKRRGIITGTDASVLDAAQQFNTGAIDPCSAAAPGSPEWDAANEHATDVLHQNHSGAEHDLTDQTQFEVTLLNPLACSTGEYTPGKVRYDGRLAAQGIFSSFFGFGTTKPFSSSTAAWGYIQAIGEGLRPFSVCEDSAQFQAYLAYWQVMHDPLATQQQKDDADAAYDGLWGTDQGFQADGSPADEDPARPHNPNAVDTYGMFPHRSMSYPSGEADDNPPNKSNPNFGKLYVDPATDSRFHTVHRIISPDPNSACGTANANRGWVDLRGADQNGAANSDLLREWLYNGYPGEVALTPHDCGTDNDNIDENCGSAPGNHNTLMEPLQTLTCSRDTAALDCKYIFPILVVTCVGKIDNTGACVDEGASGENAEYVHSAFLFIVLRGFGFIDNNTATLGLDMEFVDVQVSGEVGGAPPANAPIFQTGTQLCGADHGGNYCPF